ncbi:MAG: c-type cytochrome [Terriglobales bacterium]|jgi:cytochrome c
MRNAITLTVVGIVIVVGVLAHQARSADNYARAEARRLTGGNPERGRDLVSYYGCNTCHTIPGSAGPRATTGPPLDHLAQRVFLAGELPNTSENLQRWIREPHSVEPKTAMPDMGVTEQDAKDLAAFLYTLR